MNDFGLELHGPGVGEFEQGLVHTATSIFLALCGWAFDYLVHIYALNHTTK